MESMVTPDEEAGENQKHIITLAPTLTHTHTHTQHSSEQMFVMKPPTNHQNITIVGCTFNKGFKCKMSGMLHSCKTGCNGHMHLYHTVHIIPPSHTAMTCSANTQKYREDGS